MKLLSLTVPARKGFAATASPQEEAYDEITFSAARESSQESSEASRTQHPEAWDHRGHTSRGAFTQSTSPSRPYYPWAAAPGLVQRAED